MIYVSISDYSNVFLPRDSISMDPLAFSPTLHCSQLEYQERNVLEERLGLGGVSATKGRGAM